MNAGFLGKFLGSGNNTTETDNNDDQNKDSNQDKDNKDNNENNIDNSKSIWDNKPKEVENDQNLNQNNANNSNSNDNNNNTNIDPQEALKSHIESLNLSDGIDLTKIQEDIQAGNNDSLTAAFSSIAENTYKASMMSMNKIMDAKIATVKTEAAQEASATMNAASAVREMNTALPFTSDPDIAPVAKAALNQFMQNGADLPTAIQAVTKFFKATAEKINSNGTPPTNLNGNNFNQSQTFDSSNNNNNNSNSTPSDHDEWVNLLSA